MNVAEFFRIERIKVRRRSAFQMAVMIGVGFIGLALVGQIFAARRFDQPVPTLPRAWSDLHQMLGQIVPFIVMVTVVNVAAIEYQWRTARQNVIDGLSREQFFLAKLITIPSLSVFFVLLTYAVALGVVATFGGVDPDPFPTTYLKASLGVIATSVGLGSAALLASVATRNVGGAVALLFGVAAIVEPLLRFRLINWKGMAAEISAYLPFKVILSLGDPAQYDAALFAREVARARPPMPPPLETPILYAVAAIYVVAFLAGAYAIVRRQDL